MIFVVKYMQRTVKRRKI